MFNFHAKGLALAFLSIFMLSFGSNAALAKKGRLGLLQGKFSGSGVFQGNRFSCRSTIRSRSIYAHCSSVQGSAPSAGTIRGGQTLKANWRTTDGSGYHGTSYFSGVGRNGHTMTVYIDGFGSGIVRMNKLKTRKRKKRKRRRRRR